MAHTVDTVHLLRFKKDMWHNNDISVYIVNNVNTKKSGEEVDTSDKRNT